MGLPADQTPQRDATVVELSQYHKAREQISQLDTTNTFDSSNPHHKLFFVSGDGTRNSRNSPDPGYVRTNPDLLEDMLSKDLENIKSHYVPGPGTDYENDTAAERLLDAATGNSCAAAAEKAYKDFVLQAREWVAKDPNAEIHVSMAGFSRGSGTIRHFANLVHERGIPDGKGGYLVPPGGVHQDVMLLYDTVTTGQETVLNLDIPPGVQVVHLTANDENRYFFPLSSVKDTFNPHDKGIWEIGFAGAHSDVGGGIEYGGLSARTLELGHYVLDIMGVPLREIPEPYSVDSDKITVHDSGDMLNLSGVGDFLAALGNIEIGDRGIVYSDNANRRSPEQQAAADQARRAEIEQAAAAREAGIEAYGSLIQLGQAVASGDGVEMARALAHYTLAQDRNAWHQGQGSSLGGAGLYGLSAVAGGLDLTQALRGGDGWAIAGETAALLRDIDSYVQANGGSFLGQDGRAVLGGVQSALNLAAAIDGGNGWAIAGSTLNLLQGINHYFEHAPSVQQGLAATSSFDHAAGLNAGTTATALGGAASAVSLGMNIAHLDDVFATGDAGQIAYSLASTANSAINTYNAGAQLAGGAGIPGAANYAAYLGYAAAALQAMEGDVQGAAVSAASAYLMTCGPYGWAAAAALTIGNMLLGGKSAPPRAHGSFGLDEHGNVVLLEVHGSSKMRGHARAFGEEMLPVLQQFQAGGGRLLIDGTLPSFTLTAGEALRLKYGNEGIGRVEVIVADSSRASLELLGILYARDRGERIEEAIKTSRDGFGNIDLARVDAILAGQGFVKQGLTYTFGETQSRAGTSRGSGERHGGGNVGPEGQVIAAKSEQIVSLPLKPNQLPSQQVGEILGAASLASNFTGWGNELFLMSLIAGGGVFGVAGPVFGRVKQEETNKEYIKPLDGYELSVYERLLASGAIPAAAEGKGQTTDGADRHVPELGPGQMQQFLDAYWDKLLHSGNPFTDLPASSAYFHRELIGYGSLLADGSKASALPPKEHWWDNWPGLTNLASAYGDKSGETLASIGADMLHGSSYSGRLYCTTAAT